MKTKIQVIYLLYVNDVVMSAHHSRELANVAVRRLLSVDDIPPFKYFIEEVPLSLKGKREIVLASKFFGIDSVTVIK